ncbi:hypothetical protein DEU34_1187 [Microbacterium sp. AG1240]|uniref:hypothetical protein n=1 Tax=Microbacterium sp. AG1240 TaxID=2183992 RepID=UPI000EB2EBEA|nr:hypothetical protein [Microbacterium sp. AG1240]RKT36667.1 hypothetical protein DEU34_1187 [Microbacterium sp. AG1240]
MHSPDDRTAELIAGAVAGALSPDEQRELAALRAQHPWIDSEIAELQRLTADLEGMSWREIEPDAALRDRITAIPHAAPSDVTPLRSVRRRRWILPAVGAACLAVGLAVGVALPPVGTTPTGPPGTLGALETVDVRDEPSGAAIDADLVAHTWGTEAILDATGLDVGVTYAIVLVGSDGTEFSAGAMLGSSVPIHCSVNAAVLREDVVRLEIRDSRTGAVASADLPEV